MATLSYIGHLFKLKVDVVPQDDIIFSHRISSEYMMVITSDQCVSVVSLFINSSGSCVQRCMTFTKTIQLFKSECDSAYYVSTLSTNEKS